MNQILLSSVVKYLCVIPLLINGIYTSPVTAESLAADLFSLELEHEPDRPRSYLLAPTLSVILPGFDQWWEGQYEAAALYSGLAIGGISVAKSVEIEQGESSSMHTRDNTTRLAGLASQFYIVAGSMSAYASFRSAVRSHKSRGGFEFLEEEESVDELWMAPFEFSHLKKPTTYLPLLLVTALVTQINLDSSTFNNNSFNASDAFYTAAYSYNAGTHEEAMFRGWMMPVAMETLGSPFWSNTAQATVFAAAHLGPENQAPVAQFLVGWYLGWLTQRNNWTLSESIFIHSWWDVIAIGAQYLDAAKNDEEPTVYLPPLRLTF